MTLFQYTPKAKRSAPRPAQPTQLKGPQTECNYSNNYYGDQVCIVKR